MNSHITPDYVARFIETTEKYIKDLEDKVNDLNVKMETTKLLTTEKNEHLIYKIGILQEKVVASEQKVNELNTIMMKHFAYKSKNVTPPPVPVSTPPLPAPSESQVSPAPPVPVSSFSQLFLNKS